MIDSSQSVGQTAGVREQLGTAFWRVWSASALSNLADGVLLTALPLLAVRLTRSPTLVAGVTVAFGLPWLLFALQAGALADRLDRRRTMALANAARAAVMVALTVAVLADVASLPVLYAAAFGVGVAQTLVDTSAQSIVPALVPQGALSRANGRLYAAELTANQFVGPPLGGLLAGIGIAWAFTTSAVGYGLAAVGLSLMAGSYRPARGGDRTTLRRDIAEGAGYLSQHRLLRTLAVMVGVGNLCFSATGAVLVLYVVGKGSALGMNEAGFGLLLTTSAIGSLAGSMTADRVEQRLGRAMLLRLSIAGGAVFAAVPAMTTNPWVVAVGFALGGYAIVLWNVVTVSLRQTIVPDRLLGRVNASYRLLAWGTIPIGGALGGVVAEAFGLRTVFLGSGVLVLCLLGLTRRTVTDATIEAALTRGGGDPIPNR